MPCIHKFHDYLDLHRIDFDPTTLIIGTFNPSWPATNHAEWFYGRTNNNNFWDVLPRLYGQQSLIFANQETWKTFCKKHQIAITDLISCIKDANEDSATDTKILRGYADKEIATHFHDFQFTNIKAILQNYPSIRNIYLTRGIGETFWRKLWKPIQIHCKGTDTQAIPLLTPSGYAFYQQARYNRNQQPAAQLNLQDFILMKWQKAWHKHTPQV